MLLVSDDSTLLTITSLYLKQIGGYSIQKTSSAEEACRILSGQNPDVIIVDMESVGLEFLSKNIPALCENGERPYIIGLGNDPENSADKKSEDVLDFSISKGTKPLYVELIHLIQKITGPSPKNRNVSQNSHHDDTERNGYLLKEIHNCDSCTQTDHLSIESQIYLKTLMDTIPAPVFYRDIQGVYRDCNRAFEELVGMKKGEILGKTIHDFFPVDLADHYRYMDDLIIKHPHIQQYEYKIINTRGEKYDAQFLKSPLIDDSGCVRGIVGLIFDISERKIFEQIVHSSEEKYRTLADFTYDWEAWLSPEGEYLYVSPSSERITGYRADEFLEEPDLSIRIVHPDDQERIRDHYRMVTVDKTNVHQMDYRIIAKNGDERWISHICQAVFRDDGTWLGRRESKRDITARKQIEKAHQQTNMKLNLLSNITRHDVLNQLSVLVGFTEMAMETTDDPDLTIMLKRIMAAADTITNQISFTRIYQNIGVYEPLWQHVPSIIQKACSGIRLATEVDVSLSEVEVLADPLLEKVFFCLLDNSERHGDHVTMGRFSCKNNEEHLILVYEDNGTGIKNTEKRMIFERGYGKNTGYGLFLVKEILGISGNTIKETGEYGKGVRFEIEFPGNMYRLTN